MSLPEISTPGMGEVPMMSLISRCKPPRRALTGILRASILTTWRWMRPSGVEETVLTISTGSGARLCAECQAVLELVAFSGDGDVFEWEAGGGGSVEVVGDVARGWRE